MKPDCSVVLEHYYDCCDVMRKHPTAVKICNIKQTTAMYSTVLARADTEF